ncbi:MAG: MFS transporter, partial [Nocardia sp.]|nr:MFS transporter [Nocardia sp.]
MPDRGYAPVSTVLRAARIANSVAFALQGYFLAVILTELPQLRDRLGLSDNTILIIVMAISVVAAAGSLLAEQMAVRWSSRTALCTGLAAITIAGLIFAVAPGITTGLIALICYGLAVGVVDASTNMQAVFIQHGYGRFVFASFYAAWSAGTIAGALFVFACEKAQLTLPYTIAIAAAIVAAAAAISGRRLLGTGRAEADAGTSESVATVRLRAYLA